LAKKHELIDISSIANTISKISNETVIDIPESNNRKETDIETYIKFTYGNITVSIQ
jgi:hypothetical protein